jgi:hypothetical protein
MVTVLATILPFLRAGQDSFDPDATRIMGNAFDAACQRLGILTDGEREAIAGYIIGAAKRGERDPNRLRDIGIQAISQHR